jgi:hypothetical protein
MLNEDLTGDLDCACGTWIGHWEKYAEKPATHCTVDGCAKPAEDGAHITLLSTDPAEMRAGIWIAPMCHEHNTQFGKEFNSKPYTTFVNAIPAVTCEKLS